MIASRHEKSLELYHQRYQAECRWANHVFVWLMLGQFLLGLAFAFFWTPYTWIGANKAIHIHVWAAVFIGTGLSGFAIGWIRIFNDHDSTRYIVAVVQMLWSALLIHLCGGRIETHFHIFASLAILSLYRDWRVLTLATVVVAADHFIRGVFYPLSVFGIVNESPYRWIEHSIWVLFEVAFLIIGCTQLKTKIRELCDNQIDLQMAKDEVTKQVEKRTKQLESVTQRLARHMADAEKLALVARFTHDAVMICDREANVEWVNEGFSNLTGYQPDEAVGKCLMEFQLAANTKPEKIEKIADGFNQKKRYSDEIEVFRKNGESIWVAIELQPVQGVDKETSRFILTQKEITERKKIELSLADTEARLRSMMDNLAGACYRINLSTQQTLFVSRWIKNLTGCSAAAFLNQEKCLRDYVHPDDLGIYDNAISSALNDKAPFAIRYRIVDAHERTRWISERGRVVSNADRSMHWVDGILFDITDSVESETRNQHLQQELVAASRFAGMAEIATNVLHNVGNILNSVNISATVIQRKIKHSALANLEKVAALMAEQEPQFAKFVQEDPRGPKIPAYISKVTEALANEQSYINGEFEELTANIEHIKEIVCLQQSMASCRAVCEKLNIQGLVEDAITAVASLSNEYNVKMGALFSESLPVLTSDRHRILRILINLLTNAIEALRESDSRYPEVLIFVSGNDCDISFEVIDNGIGIEEKNIDKIFRYGFTTKKSGHGFGLHSSANTATELSGNIRAQSDGLGKGATFTLTLPLHASQFKQEVMS